MKLTLTQRGVTVTIEEERDGHTTSQMTQFCRQLLAGQGYTEDQIKESMASEEDVTEQVQRALEGQRNIEKRIDKDEGLTEDCGNI